MVVISAWPADVPRLQEMFKQAGERRMRWGVAVPVIFPATTDLGTLADCGSAGYAINARGQVTGVSQRRALLEGHLWCVGP